jgi:hypothetical protein
MRGMLCLTIHSPSPLTRYTSLRVSSAYTLVTPAIVLTFFTFFGSDISRNCTVSVGNGSVPRSLQIRFATKWTLSMLIRWNEKAGLQRDAIRSQCSTCSRHKKGDRL